MRRRCAHISRGARCVTSVPPIRISPDVGSITINTPAAAGTTVTFDGYAELDTVEGTITGTVTDTSNGHTTTVDVVVSHHYLGEI